MKRDGFTIVELLIVIVVIAILAAISITAYGNIQVRGANSARHADLRQAENLISMYYSSYGVLPSGASSMTYCLGGGYPNGRCNNTTATTNGPYSNVETDTTFTAPLSEHGTLQGKRNGLRDYAGPYLWVWDSGNGFSLIQFFQGEDGSLCPEGYSIGWNDPSSDLITCSKDYLYD